MTRVVAVHGINNTYSAPAVMGRDWVPALIGGVQIAGHQNLLQPGDVTCVFWGDVFRRPGRFLGDDLETLAADDVEDGAEADLLQQWWREAATTDGRVIPPDERSLGVASGVQAALAALAGSRFLANASERLLILWLKQVRGYFTDPGLREQIQDRFAEAVADDTRVVVAHSLGSVVAYEALHAHPEWNVTHLVTVGSPLGIRNIVLDRLAPAPTVVDGRRRGAWPGRVTRWTNVADERDFVALVKRLHPVFGEEIVDIEIDNGATVHAVERYLTSAEVGAAVAAGLRSR